MATSKPSSIARVPKLTISVKLGSFRAMVEDSGMKWGKLTLLFIRSMTLSQTFIANCSQQKWLRRKHPNPLRAPRTVEISYSSFIISPFLWHGRRARVWAAVVSCRRTVEVSEATTAAICGRRCTRHKDTDRSPRVRGRRGDS